MSLNEREKYCLALFVTRGGEASYDEIRDIILASKESFKDLSEKYLRHKAIKNTILTLVRKGYLSKPKPKFYKINPIMVMGFIQQFPIMISKGITSNLRYRKEHILEFDTSEIESVLLDDEYIHEAFKDPPYYLVENLREALNLQKMGSYDSVLVKCGKCVENMVDELNYDYSLFDKELTTGRMINELRNQDVLKKMKKKINMDDFRTFVDGINVVYRFRNIMGAHVAWDWGIDQVATSCLILTFYLANLYLWEIRKEE
ncbi:MAG: hypothetical protein ACFFDC_21125 [Promethearchaeota archaeon]